MPVGLTMITGVVDLVVEVLVFVLHGGLRFLLLNLMPDVRVYQATPGEVPRL
jgi:hypothetical protein